MKAKKYKHLSFEDRCIIEEFNIKKIDNDDIDFSIGLSKK